MLLLAGLHLHHLHVHVITTTTHLCTGRGGAMMGRAAQPLDRPGGRECQLAKSPGASHTSELAKRRASDYSRQMPNLNLITDPFIYV